MTCLRASLVAVLVAGPALAQTGDFEFCSPDAAGLTACPPEVWRSVAGDLFVQPSFLVPPQSGFPTSGAQWLILDPPFGVGSSSSPPPGGPAPYPFPDSYPSPVGSLVFEDVTLGTVISFDWTYVQTECGSSSFFNDFLTVDVVDPATGLPVANVLYQDTFSGNYAYPALSPNPVGSVATCTTGGEVAPAGVAKSTVFSVPAHLVGGVYDVAFHVSNAGDATAAPYLWLDDVVVGPKGAGAACVSRSGILGTNPEDFTCKTFPLAGQVWESRISKLTTLGTGTLQTLVVVG